MTLIEVPVLVEDNGDNSVTIINTMINLNNVLMYYSNTEDPEYCTDIVFISPLFDDGSKIITIYEPYSEFTKRISS